MLSPPPTTYLFMVFVARFFPMVMLKRHISQVSQIVIYR